MLKIVRKEEDKALFLAFTREGKHMMNGIGGGSPFGGQTFGAQVVTATLDSMNGASSGQIAPTDKQSFGAAVVSKTLDYANSNQFQHRNTFGSANADYDFQKSVLSAAYNPVGSVLDTLG